MSGKRDCRTFDIKAKPNVCVLFCVFSPLATKNTFAEDGLRTNAYATKASLFSLFTFFFLFFGCIKFCYSVCMQIKCWIILLMRNANCVITV